MRDYIFQLEKEKVTDDKRLSVDTCLFYDDGWFCREVADYVENVTEEERSAAVNSLVNANGGTFKLTGKDELMLLNDGVKSYFRPKFEQFKDLVEKVTLESFCTGLPYDLHSSITGEFKTYIYNEECLEPLDNFLRYAEDGAVYHVGGVLEYRH